jgi:hypothetical protein
MNSLSSSTVTVAPGQVLKVFVTGKVFSCVSSTALFSMSFDDNRYFSGQSGLVIEVPEDFEALYFRNDSGSAITITFYAGSAKVIAQGYEPKRSPTGCFSGGPYVLNAGVSQAFVGSQTNPHVRQWVFTNRHATAAITLYNATVDPVSGVASIGANALATIFPLSSFTIETSDALAIKNETATNGVTVDVCTIAYT